eukprot:TRINITY_DN7216_c0_g1_i5.p1 TRINITY_DN7216_c0_g1~~TRINITY_DN7216_c0_g1_i5.p1  ORF type:complete len:256 (-),score=70.18 TRINITY_DN7216_c0_g1_i5:133-852(-)
MSSTLESGARKSANKMTGDCRMWRGDGKEESSRTPGSMSSMSTAATAVPRTAWPFAASAACDSEPDQDKEKDGSKEKEKDGSKDKEADGSKDKEKDDSEDMEKDDSEDKETDESEDKEKDESEDMEKDDSEDKEKDGSKERRHAAYAAWARGGSHLLRDKGSLVGRLEVGASGCFRRVAVRIDSVQANAAVTEILIPLNAEWVEVEGSDQRSTSSWQPFRTRKDEAPHAWEPWDCRGNF